MVAGQSTALFSRDIYSQRLEWSLALFPEQLSAGNWRVEISLVTCIQFKKTHWYHTYAIPKAVKVSLLQRVIDA